MSRIAKTPIAIPKGVQISITPQMVVSVKGPKGEHAVDTLKNVVVTQDANGILVRRHGDASQDRAFHGLYYRLIQSAVVGVTEGYTRQLELSGVGYKADLKGSNLTLNVGFSHTVSFPVPKGITVVTPNPTTIVITGIDKALVGQLAANVRNVAPPEPYKGKGIKYQGEVVRRKVGKATSK